VLSRRLSSQESRDSLLERLDTSTEVIDRIYGGHFHDPALTALYAEEAREVVKKMKATVCRTAKEWDDLAALDR
jgi:hypothetical protein